MPKPIQNTAMLGHKRHYIQSSLLRATAISALAALGLPLAAASQTTDETTQETQPDTATDEVRVWNTVTVTAQRREQSLGDVPISVSVLSGEALETQRIGDLSDLASYVPSLTVPDRPGSNGASIRGLGTGGRNALFEQAVVLQVDGITSARQAQFVAPYFDVERVEVLRGPQGVLFGKNATAGAISITTANPTDSFTASVTGGYEFENGGALVRGYVSGPMTETLSGRLAILHNRDGSDTIDRNLGQEVGEEDTLAVRGTLDWNPMSRLSARLKLDAGEVEQLGNNIEMNSCSAASLDRILGVSPTEDCTMNGTTARGFLDVVRIRSESATGTINYDFDSVLFTSITGYSQYDLSLDGDLDLTPSNGIHRYTDEAYSQFYQEFRLTSTGDGPLTYVLGVTGQRQNVEINDITDINVFVPPYNSLPVFPPFNPLAHRRSLQVVDQTSTAYSVFAHATLDVTDRFRVLGGARYTEEEKEIDYDVTRFLWGTWQQVPSPLDILIEGRTRNESNVDPQLGVQYDITGQLMGYVTGSIVHKGGGFNVDETESTLVDATFEFEPEEAESLEAGLKWSANNAFLNLTLFRTEFSNLQVASNDGVSTSVRNAAVAITQGVEVDGMVHLGDYVTMSGGVAYLDATFDNYPGGSCTIEEATAIAPAPCTADLAGNRLTFAPEWSANFVADARLPINPDLVAPIGASINYKSEQFTQENNDPLLGVDAITTVDLRAGISRADDSLGVRLVARNIFDEIEPAFIFPFPTVPGTTGAVKPRGRSVLLEVTATY